MHAQDAIDVQVDHAARLLVISVIGEVVDDTALREVPRIWLRHPEVLAYDSLIDLTRDAGRISWDAVSTIAERWRHFAGERDRGRRTALVVRNEQWESYAGAIAAIFQNRVFKVCRSLAEARTWLSGGGEGHVVRNVPPPRIVP